MGAVMSSYRTDYTQWTRHQNQEVAYSSNVLEQEANRAGVKENDALEFGLRENASHNTGSASRVTRSEFRSGIARYQSAPRKREFDGVDVAYKPSVATRVADEMGVPLEEAISAGVANDQSTQNQGRSRYASGDDMRTGLKRFAEARAEISKPDKNNIAFMMKALDLRLK